MTLSKNINPSLVLIQSRKTRPFITERLLMGREESNQTNKTNIRTGKSLYGLEDFFFVFNSGQNQYKIAVLSILGFDAGKHASVYPTK